MFPPIEYLEWMQGRPEAALYDLGSSGLRGDRGREPTPIPEPVAGLSDPPAGVTLHTQLAAAYGVQPEQVVVTAGATHANLLAAAVALQADSDADEGDDAQRPRVLVEKPGYEPLVRTPAALGATVDRFLRTGGEGEDLPERVRNALRTGTRLVTLTNRHNPTGRLLDRDALAAAAETVHGAAADATLLVDEAYAPFVLDPEEGRERGPFGGVTAAGLESAVVTGTLSKFHGLDDLRVGWLVADEAFARTARRVKHHLPAVAGPTTALARRVLFDDGATERSRELLAANAETLAAFVDDRSRIEGRVYPGSHLAFLSVEGVDGDEVAAAAWEAGVLVVPGRFFSDPDGVRVSLGGRPDDAAAALRAFAGVLGDLS